MSYGVTPPPVTANINVWAQNIVNYLKRTASRLQFKIAGASASEDGTILWDGQGGYPIVSKGGEWRQIVLADGYAIFGQDADVTAAAVDTAYKIALDDIASAGITLTGSPLTDITFIEGGLYEIAFTAQISSTSSSTVNFRFWPRINTVDVGGSTIVASLHNNGATIVVSRTAIFSFAAGDVLNVMWATDSTNGLLKAHSATAYAPSAPSVTLAITRVQA
jgi:hypothetical protein